MTVFADEWRRCLREQYKYVIRNNDRVTRPSLTDVLHSVGFTNEELRQLELEATMRVEDMPDDFMPDLEILNERAVVPVEDNKDFVPHPLECQCPACIQINLKPHDAEGQPLEIEKDELLEVQKREAAEPKQLSLF